MPVTSPDNIYFSDTSAPADINAVSASEATSVQAAFALRQRYEFVWANAAARTAQTGMTTGSTGYQVDTKAEYIYESATWRLKTSYAEYTTPNQSVASGVAVAPSALNYNATLSTDSTFTSSNTTYITITQPGVYALSWTLSALSATGTNSYAAVYSDAAHTNFVSLTGFTQGAVTVPLPFYRVPTANTPLYFFMVQFSGAPVTISGTLRIGRLG